MSPKPTILFVPGAWHGPEAFEEVSGMLQKQGYKCAGVTLPSVGAMPPLKSFDEDVAAVREVVKQAVGNEEDVIVTMHSYGGLPGCDAVKGLTQKDQERNGKKGGVIKMLFITSFVLPEGGSLLHTALQGNPLPWFNIKGDEIYAMDPGNIFYNDLDEKTAQHWISKLKVHSYPTMSSKVTYPAWQYVPSTYLLCEADNAIPIQAQQGMVQASGMPSETCSAGHSPFLSQPEFITGFIRRSVGEGV